MLAKPKPAPGRGRSRSLARTAERRANTVADQATRGPGSSGSLAQRRSRIGDQVSRLTGQPTQHARLVEGERAREVTQALGAPAAAQGSSVFLSPGFRHLPHARQDHILAHELTHVTEPSSELRPYTCPSSRDEGERKDSFDEPFEGRVVDHHYSVPIQCGDDALTNIHDLRAWRIEGFAVGDIGLRSGAPVFRKWMAKVAKRQQRPVIHQLDSASKSCGVDGTVGYYRAAHVVGHHDCIGDGETNEAVAIGRAVVGEKMARHHGVNIIDADNAEKYARRGALTIDIAGALDKLDSEDHFGGYPALNKTAAGRRTNRSITIFELPRLARSDVEDSMIGAQAGPVRAENAKTNFDELYDEARKRFEPPFPKIKKCMWGRVRDAVRDAVDENARNKVGTPPKGGKHDEYLPGRYSKGVPTGGPDAWAVAGGFERAKAAHREEHPMDYARMSWSSFMRSEHLSTELYPELAKSLDKTSISDVRASMDQIAMRAIGGLHEFGRIRRDTADSFMLDSDMTETFRKFFASREDDLYCCFKPDNGYYWGRVNKGLDGVFATRGWELLDAKGECR